MLSMNTVASLGLNSALSGAYYLTCTEKSIPAQAICGSLTGVVFSTLFQICYPEHCDQIRDTCGDTVTRAITWLYPGLAFLGGAIGGTPYQINLFVSSAFAVIHFFSSSILWGNHDSEISDEIKKLCSDATAAIENKNLNVSKELIDQAVALTSQLVDPKRNLEYQESIDSTKVALIKAYLDLTILNLKEAEALYSSIKNPKSKAAAFELLGLSLIKHAAAVDQTEAMHAESQSMSVIRCLDEIGKFKEKIASLPPTSTSLKALLSLIEKAKELDKADFVKACIHKAEGFLLKCGKDEFPDHDRLKGYLELELVSNQIVNQLVQGALSMELWEEVESLLQNEFLKGLGRIHTEIAVAKSYGKPHIERAKAHAAKAMELIEAVDSNVAQEDARKALIDAQVQFDSEGARLNANTLVTGRNRLLLQIANQACESKKELATEIMREMEEQFESLGVEDRLSLLEVFLTT